MAAFWISSSVSLLHPDALLTYCFPLSDDTPDEYHLWQAPASNLYHKAQLLTGEGCQPAHNLSAFRTEIGFYRIYIDKASLPGSEIGGPPGLPLHRRSWVWVWSKPGGGLKYVQVNALEAGDQLIDQQGSLHPITKVRRIHTSKCFYAHTESEQLVVDQFLVDVNEGLTFDF